MDVTEQDQEIDPNADARWNRMLKPGTYDFTVVDAQEGVTNGGKNKITLTLVTNPSPEAAPEGPVKIDFVCTVGTFSLRNLIETFEPEKLGKKATLDTAAYKGCIVKASTKWEEERAKPDGSGTYKARPSIIKLIGRATKPAAAEAPF